jgi:hypothetical protein
MYIQTSAEKLDKYGLNAGNVKELFDIMQDAGERVKKILPKLNGKSVSKSKPAEIEAEIENEQEEEGYEY